MFVMFFQHVDYYAISPKHSFTNKIGPCIYAICMVHYRVGNVTSLLAWREVAPRVKRPARRLWGEAASGIVVHAGPRLESISAELALTSWLALHLLVLQSSFHIV